MGETEDKKRSDCLISRAEKEEDKGVPTFWPRKGEA